jgi:hypothetical protein
MECVVFWAVTTFSSQRDPDVSVEHIAFIFSVEEEAKEETSRSLLLPVSCLGYSATLKIQAIYLSEEDS